MRRVLASAAILVLACPAYAAASATVNCTNASASVSNSAGSFHVLNGKIIGPAGQPFIARGIGVIEGQQPSVAQLQKVFPGTNFVRLAVYDYASAAKLEAYVEPLTAAGIVVEIEDHNNNSGNAGGSQGRIFTGTALATELAWYSSIASAFRSNPYVWFGTDNEPSEIDASGATDPAALSTWQQKTYQAIRSAGNTSPIMVEMNCDANSCGVGYTQSVYASMTNIVWDLHYYNWLTGYSTDQPTIAAKLNSLASQTQTFKSGDGVVPVLIGEYGNSTTGADIDPGGEALVATVIASGGNGQFGSAAWAWGTGNPGDGLLDSAGSPSSPYGQQVKLFINISIVLPSACELQQQVATTVAAAQQKFAAQTSKTEAAATTTTTTLAPSDSTPATQALASPDPSVAAGNAAAQSVSNQADAILQQAAAALQAIHGGQ